MPKPSEYLRTLFAAIGGRAEMRSAPSRDLFPSILGSLSKSGTPVNEETALSVSTLYACVSLLADMAGKIPCKLYRKTAKGREEATDHRLYDMLSVSPNGEHTAMEFRRFIQGCAALRGNGYAFVRRNQFYEVEAIEPIDPREVRAEVVKMSDGRRFVQFVIGGKSYSRADILHIPGFSTNGFTGVSAVRSMVDTIGNALAQRDHTSKTFANGAKFPGFLTTPNSLTAEQLKQIKDAWQSQYGGTENAGKTPVLYGGLDFKTVGMSNEDAELIASQQFTAGEIATFFRMPPHLVGLSEKSTSWGTGIEQQTQGFLNFTLDPWLITWEQAQSLTLLTADERAAGYFIRFNRNALLQTAAKDRAEVYRTMRDIGAMCINDIRRLEEMDDLPDNIGDNYTQPFNGSGGSAPAKPAAQPSNAQE